MRWHAPCTAQSVEALPCVARLGRVSRDCLADKALVLYFEGKQRDEALLRALQQVYKQFGCEEGLGHFEVVYITAAESAEQFAACFRAMPWLTLPFTHALRREHLLLARQLARPPRVGLRAQRRVHGCPLLALGERVPS